MLGTKMICYPLLPLVTPIFAARGNTKSGDGVMSLDAFLSFVTPCTPILPIIIFIYIYRQGNSARVGARTCTRVARREIGVQGVTGVTFSKKGI